MLYTRSTGVVHPIRNESKLEDNDNDEKLKMERNNFEWSLQPIAKCMGVMGIPFLPSDDNPICQLTCHFCRIFCFLLVFFIQLSLVIQVCYDPRNIANSYTNANSTMTFAWNFIIDNLNLALYTVGSHIYFLMLTQPKTWTDLTQSYKLLEENGHSTEIYPACRRIATKVIFYMITMIICLDVLLGVDLFFNDAIWARKILDLFGLFTRIYPAVQLVLFCVLVKMMSLQLKSIRKRITDQYIPCPSTSPALVETQRSQLTALRSHHRLICKTIQKLNRYFGVFLTIEVIFIFVSVINCSIFVVMSALSADKFMLGAVNVTVCIDSLVHLFLLSSFSDEIANQTYKVYEALLQLLHHRPSLQNEVTLFTEQLVHMKTHIHAMGFFNVGKHLFPSLIGTTLTYFFILLQFHSAEKL